MRKSIIQHLIATGMLMLAEGDGSPNEGGATQPDGDKNDAGDDGVKTGEDEPKDDDKLGEGGVKALAAERERARKAEAELVRLRKEAEDAKLTADEKAAKALKEAEETAKTATVKALRYEAAAKAGLDLNLAGRLQGSDLDALVSDAETLKTLMGKPATGEPEDKSKKPKPDSSQGKGSGGKAGDAGLTDAQLINKRMGI